MIARIRIFMATLLLAQPVTALTLDSAVGLEAAYQLALQHDATYQAAYYENQAGQQYKEIGTASLLPVVSANYSKYTNKAEVEYEDSIRTTDNRDYDSEFGSLQLRQPIINFEAMARYRLGNAQATLSEQEFTIRKQELIVRVFNQYAAALYAENVLALAVTQRDAYAEQKKSNEVMFKQGEGTKTDILESQAKFDLTEADVIEARDVLNNERNKLAQLLGQEVTALSPLLSDFRLQPMQPASLQEWEGIALQNNAEIIAAQYALDVAKEDINRNRAGHFPRLDAVASLNRNASDTVNSYNQTADTRSIGLQITVPIYSGGLVTAYTSQAQSKMQKAQAELDKKINDIQVELQKQFNLAQSSRSRLSALESSVKSAELLIEATQKSIKGGTRTNLDALNAVSQLSEAKRDLALARYNYLQSYLNLRKAAGTLNLGDLKNVATYFVKN